MGYKLTLTRNSDNSVLKKANATNNDKFNINGIEWYVPRYPSSMEQQKLISKQFLIKVVTELRHVEGSIFMKVNSRIFWTFELVTQEGINVPIWIIVAFQQRDRQESQNSSNYTFYGHPVTKV